jgi:hypothetical protein
MAIWLQQLHAQALPTSFPSPTRRRKPHQHRRYYPGKLYFINNSTAVAVAEGRSFSFVSDPTIRYPRCFVFFSFCFSAFFLLFCFFLLCFYHYDKKEQRHKQTQKLISSHKNCKETKKSAGQLFLLFYLQPILFSSLSCLFAKCD